MGDAICLFIYLLAGLSVCFFVQKDLLQITGVLTFHFVSPQVHNVAFAFELMQDGGLKKPKARPEGIFIDIHNRIVTLFQDHKREINGFFLN